MQQIDVARISSEEQAALRRRFPSRFWEPNLAQRRVFGAYSKILEVKRTVIVTFGNRTGKTEGLGEFLAGLTKGNAFVNQKCCDIEFFKMFDEKRMAGTLTIWWICDGEYMKVSGSNHKIIKKHIPDAHFTSRTNNGVYREIKISTLGKSGEVVENTVSVKTHDMETTSFESEQVDVIICDEPPPQKHWAAIGARLVNLAGEFGGYILIGGTPLKLSAYLLDLIEDGATTGKVQHLKGSIWENCKGSELPEEQALRLGVTKDPTTGEYDTGGVLSREGIEEAIAKWKKDGDPDILSARVDGEFGHIQGRIYKTFDLKWHTCRPYQVPKDYPILQIVDPHDATPDAVGWYAVTPSNRLVGIAEYPEREYELLTNRGRIEEEVEAWRQIESGLGIDSANVFRYADPNKMMDPDPNTGLRLYQLYARHGFRFNLNITDSLEFGHEIVRKFLYFPKDKAEAFPDDSMFLPKLVLFETMRNHITYMQKYGRKDWKDPAKAFPTEVSDKWKHYADIVRYACVVFRPYDVLKETIENKRGEWDKIKNARNPHLRKSFAPEIPGRVRIAA